MTITVRGLEIVLEKITISKFLFICYSYFFLFVSTFSLLILHNLLISSAYLIRLHLNSKKDENFLDKDYMALVETILSLVVIKYLKSDCDFCIFFVYISHLF